MARPEDTAGLKEAIAMHRAAQNIKETGGSVEIGGVKITPCDTFGDTEPATAPRGHEQVAITSVTLTPASNGAHQLLITDDTGRVIDLSGAVFNERLAVREVGADPDFRAYGLDVTLVLTPGSETSVAAPSFVPPSIPVNSTAGAASPTSGDEPLPDPEPEVMERWVKVRGDARTVIAFTDDGADDDSVHVPWPLQRKLLEAAGFEREYVRDDVGWGGQPLEATEQWVRLDGVGHLETINLVPDPDSTVTLTYARYRALLRQTGWQEVQDR